MGKGKTTKRPTLPELMRRLTWWAARNPHDANAADSALSAETFATLQAVGRASVTPDIQHTVALAVFNLLVLQARALPGGTLYDRWEPLNPNALAEVLGASRNTVGSALRALYELGFIELRPRLDGRGRDVRIARPPDAAHGGKEGEAFRW